MLLLLLCLMVNFTSLSMVLTGLYGGAVKANLGWGSLEQVSQLSALTDKIQHAWRIEPTFLPLKREA